MALVKAVAVGEKHLVLGFKGVGFEVLPVDTAEDFHREALRLSRQSDVGLVLATESMAEQSPQTLEDFRANSAAILVVIPSHEGSKGFSFAEMRKAVERSIGVDILGKE